MSNDIPTLKFDPFEDDKSSESKKAGEITNKEEQVQHTVEQDLILSIRLIYQNQILFYSME